MAGKKKQKAVKQKRPSRLWSLLTGLIPSRKKSDFVRKHERLACSAFATVQIVSGSRMMSGLILEVSQGGVKFRPAKEFLLDMRDVPISIKVKDWEATGTIVATRTDGYGVALFHELSQEMVREFVAMHPPIALPNPDMAA